MTILLGNGDGTFTAAPAISLPQINQAVAADFNGDGKVDLALTLPDTATDNVRILMGNGDGTFSPGSAMTLPDGGVFIATGDFNNDGKADLVLAQGDITVLLGNGDGTFRPGTTIAGLDSYSMVVRDFNGDGKLDFAAVDFSSGTVTVLLGNGDGTFTQGPAKSYISSGAGTIT